VSFSASASGSAPTVQWYLINYQGTNAIAGATNTTLNLTAGSTSPGGYFALFSNVGGSATTSVANLAVLGLPFVNGSFESINNHAAIPAGTGAALHIGDTWLTGWTVGGSASDQIGVCNGTQGSFAPYDGQQDVWFNTGNSPSGGNLSQTFTTTVGQSYAVTFALNQNGSGNMSLTATAVSVNGALLASNYCVSTYDEWTLFNLPFTAISTNTTLVFTDTSESTVAVDLQFDDVTVVTPPVIVTSPVSQTNFIGSTVTFSASASDSPATVQWFQGITPILNATNATLSFTVNAGSGGNYTAVFANAAGSATTAVATLTVCIPALLTQQPQSLTTNVGATVTFTGAAGGSAPLSLQWQFDGTNISGATDANLVLTNAQPANSGSYTLVASNPYGTNTSTNAVLTFISTVQVGIGSGAGAGTPTVPVTTVPVMVPINLLATGTENGLLCNIDYDTNFLTFASATSGSGASGAAFYCFAPTAGKLVLAVLLNTGATFAAGTQQVAQVTFQAVLVKTAVTTPIGFGSQPISPGISDANGNPLPAAFVPGSLTITPTPLEGDVSPITGPEKFFVGITDWVQEGRFAAGLDLWALTNASEFQRADCSPYGSLGDGYITVADWTQVGLYALGLDPPTVAGGPTGPPSGSGVAAAKAGKLTPQGKMTPNDTGTRTISLTPVTQGGTTDSASVQMVAQGNENSLQFGLSFDPTVLSFVSASPGIGAPGATLVVNTNNKASGQLGIVVGYLPPQTFAAGTQQVVTLTFSSVSYSTTTSSLAFATAPIPCQVAAANAGVLAASYQNASLQVGAVSWPLLAISRSAGNIILSWPSAPTVLNAQWSTNLASNWTSTGGAPVTNGGTIFLTLPAPTNTTFFRLCGQ
jgi:hypothetical protein